MSSLRTIFRPLVIAVARRGLRRVSDPVIRELLWSRVVRIDDEQRTHSRALMSELFGIEIGRMTYGAFLIDGSIGPGTKIGAFCSVAPGVRLGNANHPLDRVTTHPFTYLANRGIVPSTDEALMAELAPPVVVEDDVWLGTNAVVLPGIRVARGAVVAAGAVVNRDVPAYTIVGGVPAKEIGRRVPEDEAARLAAIDWTTWSDERLRSELDSFRDVQRFLGRNGDGDA